MIMEVRDFLSENVYTCFYTNYYLEHNGSKLSDYDDVSQLDLRNDNRLIMRPQHYSDKSARQHISKVNELLTNPKQLHQQMELTPEQEELQQLEIQQLENDEFEKKQIAIIQRIQ